MCRGGVVLTTPPPIIKMSKLQQKFFQNHTLQVAKNLIGKLLCVKTKNKLILSVIITETEAYHGQEDDACHAHRGKTKRNEIMFDKAGYTYVYFTYGMHHLLNIVTYKKNFPSAVLIRGATIDINNYVEFTDNTFNTTKPFIIPPKNKKILENKINDKVKNAISQDRFGKNYDKLSNYQRKNLLNGPAKLTQALQITTQTHNKVYAIDSNKIWFEDLKIKPNPKFLQKTKRIGIDYAEKSKNWEYRFIVEL